MARAPMPPSRLKPNWFQVLLVLAEGARHGYAIRTLVEERTDGEVKLWPATLYGSLREMEEEGLIAETDAGEAPGDDARRRYYRITARGRGELLAETERLAALVEDARRALGGA